MKRHPTIHLRRKLPARIYGLLAGGSVAVIVVAWALTSYSGAVSPIFLPTPSAVVASAAVLVQKGDFANDIWMSFARIAMGAMLSMLVAIPLGIYISVNKHAEAIFDPIIGFIRYVPAPAFVPLFILWFGIDEMQKILFIFAVVAPYVVVMVTDAVSSVKKELTEAALTLGAGHSEVIRHVIIPSSLPAIWDAARLMTSWAWASVVFAEMVAATSGLGHMIVTAQRFLRTSDVFVAILVIGCLGLATEYIFRLSYRNFFPWAEKTRHA